MERILRYFTIFLIVCVVLSATAGAIPRIGYYELQDATNHINNASPTGDSSAMSFYSYYLEAAKDAWSIWEHFSGDGEYAVKVTIPEEPTSYKDGVPQYLSDVYTKNIENPLAKWKLVKKIFVEMPSDIDSDGVRRIYKAMESGLFGLPFGSPSAVASNIAVTTAEITANSQLAVWLATFEAVLYVMGLSDTLE